MTEGQGYFLGVDGGGSKTLALLIDEQGQECGRGLSGSCNHYAIGAQRAIANLQHAVAAACQSAHTAQRPRAAWFGLAGVDRPGDYSLWLPHLNALAEIVYLTGDVELVLSVLDDRVGIALVAGTGSIALGRDEQGHTWRVGGWGHLLGDEGSGYDLGRQALQAVLRASDGRGPATLLSTLVMEQWQLRHAGEILGPAYSEEGKEQVARLAPLVLRAAQAGDATARRIVRRAGNELARLALTASRHLSFPEDAGVPLALGGGLLLNEVVLREAFLLVWQRHRPVGPIVLAKDPALSAARAALLFTREATEAEMWQRQKGR